MGDAIIPDDWEGEYCEFAVCWPNSPKWKAVLRGVLTIPYEGRFWDEASGNIKDTQAIVEETFDFNLENYEVIMSCGNGDLAQALNNIAIAIETQRPSAGGCGQSNLVQNNTYCFSGGDVNIVSSVTLPSGSPFPVFGSEPSATVTPGGYPTGYENKAQYDADKCAKATKLTDDWTTSVRNMGYVNWGSGVIGAAVILACIVGVITVPPAAIPILLFALTANVGISALLIELANQMESHRTEIICAMYNGDSVDTIISVLADIMDGLIALMSAPSAIAVILMQVAMLLINSDTLNLLFTAAAKAAYPDADCSGCGCYDYEVTQNPAYDGTFSVVDDILSATTGARQQHGADCFYGWVVLEISCPVTLEFISSTGSAPGGGCVPPNQGKYQLTLGGLEVYKSNTDPQEGDRFYVDFMAYQTDQAGGNVEWRIIPYQA